MLFLLFMWLCGFYTSHTMGRFILSLVSLFFSIVITLLGEERAGLWLVIHLFILHVLII